jgi:N-glycosylase/DNA lyase
MAICPDIERKVASRNDAALGDDELWWELSACILSSQVQFNLAAAAASAIQDAQILFRPPGSSPDSIREDLYKILSEPLATDVRHRRYRFPRAKADQLTKAWLEFGGEASRLGDLLRSGNQSCAIRELLVDRVSGVGPKQASMLLRNTATSYDIAILDTHVVNYMSAIYLCDVPRSSLSRLGSYEKYEATLRDHADELGYPVGLVDWAIWIVMRVAHTQTKAGTAA